MLDLPLPHDPSEEEYRRPVLTNGPCNRDSMPDKGCNADLQSLYEYNGPTHPAIYAVKRQLDSCAKIAKDNGAPAIARMPRVMNVRAVGVAE